VEFEQAIERSDAARRQRAIAGSLCGRGGEQERRVGAAEQSGMEKSGRSNV
jgi:hypothetical protein